MYLSTPKSGNPTSAKLIRPNTTRPLLSISKLPRQRFWTSLWWKHEVIRPAICQRRLWHSSGALDSLRWCRLNFYRNLFNQRLLGNIFNFEHLSDNNGSWKLKVEFYQSNNGEKGRQRRHTVYKLCYMFLYLQRRPARFYLHLENRIER